ncbi:HAMP domain-containing protein, partial [bacterium]|nr:HAMP domain-containing protein [bacterium]
PIQPINKYSVNFSLSSGQKICQILVPISIQTDKKEIEMEEMMFIDKAESEKKITEVIGLVHIGLSLKKMDFLLVQITKKIGLITICIIIIGIGGAILLISAIVKPIRTLIDEARKIAKGNLNRQVPIYSHDEIGELSSAFNRMVKELQKSKKEMEHYNKTLEEKVEERTKKLKDAQSQLIQSAKMAAIGQLGASVAHELNNPLGGILGYAQHLLNKIKKTDFRVVDFKKCEKNLTYIEIEAQRCKEIVENLLIFSRKPVSPQKPLNLKLVLETTLFVLNHSLSSHNIKVISHVDPDLKKVIGDANQLQQVFTNIIINSQHAMQKEGTLTIIAQNKNKNEIEVSFSDTGCGISRENINKIFEPFFTTKQDHKGTGLGLSISYEIIKKHQGKIKVKSEIGKGTTFTIILAICKA